jgi:gas vesicle protein GvpN
MTKHKLAIEPQPQAGFVDTEYVQRITGRALSYLRAGYPVHLRGPSGTGKTTVAFHLAYLLDRPVVLIHGDEEYSSSDFVGGEYGLRYQKLVDNFVHSVLKREERLSRQWVDSRLTVACRFGYTLIYDEFTRSRPEANNVLLSVLEERILDLPAARDGGGYLRVRPDFSAIFTSNPSEYAGTYMTQDALRDRMITIDLSFFDRETEVAITSSQCGLPRPDAETIVDLVRLFRKKAKAEFSPTVRVPVMIGRVARERGTSVATDNLDFVELCADVISSACSRTGSRDGAEPARELVYSLARKGRAKIHAEGRDASE